MSFWLDRLYFQNVTSVVVEKLALFLCFGLFFFFTKTTTARWFAMKMESILQKEFLSVISPLFTAPHKKALFQHLAQTDESLDSLHGCDGNSVTSQRAAP